MLVATPREGVRGVYAFSFESPSVPECIRERRRR